MKLWVVRHGESETNAEHRHGGWFQASLTQKGIKQAERAGEILKEIQFDRVISSDLVRARQTAEAALPKNKIELEPLIREINVGCLQGRFVSECLEAYGQPYVENKKSGDYTSYGGENRAMHLKRIAEFMKKAEAFNEENVAVFTHEFVLRGMLNYALDMDIQKPRVFCGNCCIGVLEYTDGLWRLFGWHNF